MYFFFCFLHGHLPPPTQLYTENPRTLQRKSTTEQVADHAQESLGGYKKEKSCDREFFSLQSSHKVTTPRACCCHVGYIRL